MYGDDRADVYSFADEPTPEPVRLPRKRRSWLAWIGELSAAGILLALMTYTGFIQIPALKKFTQVSQPRAGDQPVIRQPMIPANPTAPAPSPKAIPVIASQPAQSASKPQGGTSDARAPKVKKEKPFGNDEAKALLAGKGIILGDKRFVLKSESEVKARLLALRSRAEEFNRAEYKLANSRNLEHMEQMVNERDVLISECRFRMERFPVMHVRGQTFHGMNVGENEEYEELRANLNELVRHKDSVLIPERNRFGREPHSNVPDAEQSLKSKVQPAMTALQAMAEAVAATKQRYHELMRDPEVTTALSRFQYEFVLSPEFTAAERELDEYQASVAGNPAFRAQ